ncbi:MAG: hypothetical protein HZB54_05235 [Deltaproteobacteria bacterium]|nr:hypothetical protein [Deltaproteobacteria bacterium]
MNVTPLEFIQLSEEKETIQKEKEKKKEVATPKRAEAVPLETKAEERQEKVESHEVKPVQDIATNTSESVEKEDVEIPLSTLVDSGVIDTQDVYTYTAPAGDNTPSVDNTHDIANKTNRFISIVRSKIEKFTPDGQGRGDMKGL